MRVLVADDVPEVAALVAHVVRLVRTGRIEVTVELDGRRAVERVSHTSFDLVVTDCRMRGADGVEVLSAARRLHPAGRRVLMTGYDEVPVAFDRLRDACVDAYLHKPLRAQDLLLLVSGLLREDPLVVEHARIAARDLEFAAIRESRADPVLRLVG